MAVAASVAMEASAASVVDLAASVVAGSLWVALAVPALSPSTGGSLADLDLAGGTSLTGLLSMGSASREGAGFMAAALLSAVAAGGMASGVAGIGAFGPIAGGRGATIKAPLRFG